MMTKHLIEVTAQLSRIADALELLNRRLAPSPPHHPRTARTDPWAQLRPKQRALFDGWEADDR